MCAQCWHAHYVVMATIRKCIVQRRSKRTEAWRNKGNDCYYRTHRKNRNVRCVERCTFRWWHTWYDWLGSVLCHTFHYPGLRTNSIVNLCISKAERKTSDYNRFVSHYQTLGISFYSRTKNLHPTGKLCVIVDLGRTLHDEIVQQPPWSQTTWLHHKLLKQSKMGLQTLTWNNADRHH